MATYLTNRKLKMTYLEWIIAQVQTDGHYYDGLEDLTEDELFSLFHVITHMKWCVERFAKENNIMLPENNLS